MEISELNEKFKQTFQEEEVIRASKTIQGTPYKEIKLDTVTVNILGKELQYDVVKTIYEYEEGQERQFGDRDRVELIMTKDSENVALSDMDDVILNVVKEQLPELNITRCTSSRHVGIPLTMEVR